MESKLPSGTRNYCKSDEIFHNNSIEQRIQCIQLEKEIILQKSFTRFLFVDNENKLIISCFEKLYIYNSNSQELLARLIGHTDNIWDMIILIDKRLATCAKDMTIRIWNINAGSYKCEVLLKGHSDFVWNIIEISDSMLLSCSADYSIILWKIDQTINEDISPYKMIKIKGQTASDCMVSLNDKQFAISSDNEILIYAFDKDYNFKLMKKLHAYTGWHISATCTLSYISKKRILISYGGNDFSLKLWNIDSGKCLKTVKLGVICIFHRLLVLSDEIVACLDMDHQLVFLKISNGKYITIIREKSLPSAPIKISDNMIAYSCCKKCRVKLFRY